MTGDCQNDPYAVLGVGEATSPAEIRNKYRLLVQILHPDRYEAGSPEVRDEAERRLKAVNEAYRVLREAKQQREPAADREAREREARYREAREREAREREAREREAQEREARDKRRKYRVLALTTCAVAIAVGTFAVMTSGDGQAWVFRSASRVSSLAVAKGIVYAGDSDGTMYALDAKTGTKRWSYNTGNAIKSSPVVRRGMVYIGSGKVYALKAETGENRWTFNTWGVQSSPVFSHRRLFVSTADHHVYELNAKNGAKLWSSGIRSSFKFSETDTGAVADGILYVIESGDGIMYALDAKTGETRWAFRGSHVFSAATDDGIVYVGDSDGNVYALDGETGARRWVSKTNIGVHAAPVVLAGMLVVPGDDGVYALDAKTGARAWTFKTRGYVWSIAGVDGIVYAGDNNSVYALSVKTGTQRWASRTGGPVYSLVGEGHTVYIGSDHGVSALEAAP